MNHEDIDPSLCSAEPVLDSLDGGFSPPVRVAAGRAAAASRSRAGRTDPFLKMDTVHSPSHQPVEPEPFPPGADTPVPNPTQLPIEPEFGQALPQAEPEDPGVPRPAI